MYWLDRTELANVKAGINQQFTGLLNSHQSLSQPRQQLGIYLFKHRKINRLFDGKGWLKANYKLGLFKDLTRLMRTNDIYLRADKLGHISIVITMTVGLAKGLDFKPDRLERALSKALKHQLAIAKVNVRHRNRTANRRAFTKAYLVRLYRGLTATIKRRIKIIEGLVDRFVKRAEAIAIAINGQHVTEAVYCWQSSQTNQIKARAP